MNSYNTNTPNFDNLLLQSLMNRLQINPPNPPSKQSLEDLLFNTLPFDDDDDDDDNNNDDNSSKSELEKEESRVEKEIIRTILTGKIESLKPNSGQAVSIGEHHICVGFHEDTGSDYRVWEWHGHVMLFDEENGYTPEYIYGNYFERVNTKLMKKKEEEKEEQEIEKDEEEEEEKSGNLGLRELIESGESNNEGRILRRNMNAGAKRV
ncbi:transcription initiation factor TFIID subunit 7-like [Lycium barbarum]|uniref:transcription initiation factor TFIID subunit 7-like n=1 Tax=Lycium barbarum TaxID=112863 RepID=UPI00293ECC83|nr:transcription initiation factor TFIID subunit 7-like [Lycium barbarum]